MDFNRKERHQARRRAFQPSLEGVRLEERVALSGVPAVVKQSGFTFRTAAGGQAVQVTDRDGEIYYIGLTGGGNIRANAAAGGRVNLVLNGTTVQSELTISPQVLRPGPNSAHTFRGRLGKGDGVLNINNIVVNTGMINNILGYKTANLSGSILLSGSNAVDRIAFNTISAGASITTGGDLNTLEVLKNLTISGAGTGISVGRDLNWLHVGGNLTISGTSNLVVTRDVGLSAQPAKGTGIAGQGALIEGNLVIASGSTLRIGRNIDNIFLVNGTTTGAPGIIIGNPSTASNFVSRGGFTS